MNQAGQVIDRELAGNGWSLRPLSGYGRIDFMVCRNWYAEIGGAPEVFVSTQPGGTTEYDLRGHLGLGFSLACSHSEESLFRHIALALEYRARGRLYSADASPAYYETISAALQFDWRLITIGAFYAVDPAKIENYRTIGVRLQVGLGARQ